MSNSNEVRVYMGLDLSDRSADYCLLDLDGEVEERGKIPLTDRGLERLLGKRERLCVVIEAGTHSPWVSRAIDELGHEALVANPRQLAFIYKSSKKNDEVDAEQLARVARLDRKLLCPIQHRSAKAQSHLAIVRSRKAFVEMRTKLVSHVRSSVKSFGHRLPGSSTPSFHKKVADSIPDALKPALAPAVECIGDLTEKIREYDKKIEILCKRQYPETESLRQVTGVGPLLSLAFVLVLEDHRRFRSRQVGAFLGLTPRHDESGQSNKQLRITKEGDVLLRSLLVNAAHYIMGPFGPDTDLRQWGERLACRGGGNARKRAIVAVARKLSMLLHSLWRSEETYEPLRPPTRRRSRPQRKDLSVAHVSISS